MARQQPTPSELPQPLARLLLTHSPLGTPAAAPPCHRPCPTRPGRARRPRRSTPRTSRSRPCTNPNDTAAPVWSAHVRDAARQAREAPYMYSSSSSSPKSSPNQKIL